MEEAEQPSLAEQRAEVTREAIRQAVTDLLIEEHPSSISIPAIAKVSGVSVRTIYRYFPTKQALLDDVANIQIRRAEQMMSTSEDLYTNPEKGLRALWEGFAEDLDAVRTQHHSPAGAQLRATRLADTKVGFGKLLAASFPDADEAELNDLRDVLMMATSSSAFLEFIDRLDRSPEDAAHLAYWAARAMQEKFARDGGKIT